MISQMISYIIHDIIVKMYDIIQIYDIIYNIMYDIIHDIIDIKYDIVYNYMISLTYGQYHT